MRSSRPSASACDERGRPWHADPRPLVEGDLDLGHRGQPHGRRRRRCRPPRPRGPRRRSRTGATVPVTPCVAPDRQATARARGRSPSPRVSLRFSRPGTRSRRRRDRGMQRSNGAEARGARFGSPPARRRRGSRRRRRATAAWIRRERGIRSGWLISASWRAQQLRAETPISIAAATPGASRALPGPRRAPSRPGPLRRGPRTCALDDPPARARLRRHVAGSSPGSSGTPSAIAACAHFAADTWPPWASARPQARTWARNCHSVSQRGTSVDVDDVDSSVTIEPPIAVPPSVSMYATPKIG